MNGKIDKIAFVLFLVLVASLSLQKPSLFYIGGLPVTLSDLIFPVTVLFFLIGAFSTRQKIRVDRIFLFLGAYLAAFAIATFISPQFTRSVIKTLATAYLVGLCVLTFNLIDNQERMRQTTRVWLFASIIPLVLGLIALALFYSSPTSSLLPYLTYHYGAVPVGNYPRLNSTFVSASMFCNFVNVQVVLLLVARHKNWIGTAFFWTMFAATAVCAIFTISSGLGAIFLAIGIWVWYSSTNLFIRRSALLTGIFVCVISLGASFIALQPHSTAPYSIQVPVVNLTVYPSARLLVWGEATGKFFEHPIFGNGPGLPSAAVRFENTEGTFSLLTDAHNSFLSVAAQTGIIGFIAMIGLVIYLLRLGFKNTANKTLRMGFAIAFLTAFVIQGLTSAFEDARHLWVLMGMLVAAATLERQIESTAEVGSGA